MRNHFPGEGPFGPDIPNPDEDIDLVEIEEDPKILPAPFGDGGPAFPRPATAFDPQCVDYVPPEDGMTLRDYFASQAMSGLIGKSIDPVQVCELAYIFADVMLHKRKGGKDAPRHPA